MRISSKVREKQANFVPKSGKRAVFIKRSQKIRHVRQNTDKICKYCKNKALISSKTSKIWYKNMQNSNIY